METTAWKDSLLICLTYNSALVDIFSLQENIGYIVASSVVESFSNRNNVALGFN